MTNNPDESRTAANPAPDAPLALDKETLKDLEPTLTDSHAVKGGRRQSPFSATRVDRVLDVRRTDEDRLIDGDPKQA